VDNITYCIWCQNKINRGSWQSIISIEETIICEHCQTQLLHVDYDNSCLKCSKKVPSNIEICSDCKNWENMTEWSNVLTSNKSLFYYNDFLKKLIALFKYRGDYEVVKGFSKPLKTIYKTYFSSMILVPIPLNKSRQYARGFNQAAAIANQIKAPCYDILIRVASDKKQSKKSRRERFSYNEKMFSCKTIPNCLDGQTILLIDDIYTTGATIRHAAKALKENKRVKIKEIYSLTIARS
jgi:competence protein ComFC